MKTEFVPAGDAQGNPVDLEAMISINFTIR